MQIALRILNNLPLKKQQFEFLPENIGCPIVTKKIANSYFRRCNDARIQKSAESLGEAMSFDH